MLRKMRKAFSLLLVFAAVFAFTAPAYAETAGGHAIVERTVPAYVGKEKDDVLNQEVPLYFIDGADDLPYVSVEDWAELLYFVNTEINGDPGTA